MSPRCDKQPHTENQHHPFDVLPCLMMSWQFDVPPLWRIAKNPAKVEGVLSAVKTKSRKVLRRTMKWKWQVLGCLSEKCWFFLIPNLDGPGSGLTETLSVMNEGREKMETLVKQFYFRPGQIDIWIVFHSGSKQLMCVYFSIVSHNTHTHILTSYPSSEHTHTAGRR